jgi:hypothetical protein
VGRAAHRTATDQRFRVPADGTLPRAGTGLRSAFRSTTRTRPGARSERCARLPLHAPTPSLTSAQLTKPNLSPLCSQPSQNLGAEEAQDLAPTAAMEGAFDLNMRIAMCLNHQLPYGDKSPEMEFFEAAFNGDLDRLRGKLFADRSIAPASRYLLPRAMRRPRRPSPPGILDRPRIGHFPLGFWGLLCLCLRGLASVLHRCCVCWRSYCDSVASVSVAD